VAGDGMVAVGVFVLQPTITKLQTSRIIKETHRFFITDLQFANSWLKQM
jgi:hypothetical protein